MASHNETLRTNSFAAPLCSSSFPLWLRLFFFFFFFFFRSFFFLSPIAYSWFYVIFPSSTCTLLANTPLLLPRSIYYHFVLRFYFMALDACSMYLILMRCLFLLFFYSASQHQQKEIRGRKGRKLDGKDNVISVVCDGWLHTPISQSGGFIYVP